MVTKPKVGIWFLALLSSLSSLCIFAAPSENHLPVEKRAPQNKTVLTKESAVLRSKQISRVSYALSFIFSPSNDLFEGRTLILFDLKPKAKDLKNEVSVDFEQGQILSVVLNGLALKDIQSPSRYDGHHLTIKPDELKSKGNQLEIHYKHAYSTDGRGLHRFKDPVDQQYYLYTHFEPYNTHLAFPCFDQPDLKATFDLVVEAPENWHVISNTLPTETTSMKGVKFNWKKWTFPQSAQFSTYLFALHAGPYSVWKGSAKEIPLRLFARKSLAKYVDYEEWLKITRQGLDFFDLQFGYPYPFGKYDQIIVPEFNSGAMENVGAVTFSERYIYRSRVTTDKRRQRANTILHEMAHMWFGDLVTMRWWNGLWLNESFATFMAAWAVDQATDFERSWQDFFAGSKQWAYWEDQLVTTHPIEVPVPDTDTAKSNFDGITYGKGASTLKQLRYLLSEDDFKEGLQRYFQKYAYKNTSLQDFTTMLSEASGQELNSWQQSWLQTSGLNTLKVDWKCETDPETQESEISQLDLIQEGSPRLHKTEIALLGFGKTSRSSGPLEAGKTFQIEYKDAKTSVKEAIGKPCPQIVFPNYQDNDYVKVELDSTSLKNALKHLSQISHPLTRQMTWHILWEMVQDGKLKAQDYADTVLRHIGKETDTLVLQKVLATLGASSAHQFSVLKILDPKLPERAEYLARFNSFAKSNLFQAKQNSDQQLTWYHTFLEVSQPSDISWIKNILDGKKKLKGFPIDQERRWELIQALSRNGSKNAKELIEAELKNDPTENGERAAIIAKASFPEAQSKAEWMNRITSKYSFPDPQPSAGVPTQNTAPQPNPPADLSLAKLREAMRSFHLIGQEDLTREYIDSYSTYLPKIALSPANEHSEFARWFSKLMFPALCDKEIAKRTSQFLETYPNLPPGIVKALKIHKQEIERCISARTLSEKEN